MFHHVHRSLRLVLGVLFVVTTACNSPAAAGPGLVTTQTEARPSLENQAPTAAASTTPAATATQDEVPTVEPTPMPTPTPKAAYGLGELIPYGDMDLMVLGWRVLPAADGLAPKAGYRYIGVHTILFSRFQGDIPISAVLRAKIRYGSGDLLGQIFEVPNEGNIAGPAALQPNQRSEGLVFFAVPVDDTDLAFVFESGFGPNHTPVVVVLGSQPTELATPESFEGEILEPVVPLGQAASLGALDIRVTNAVVVEVQSDVPGIALEDPALEYLSVDVAYHNTGASPVAVASDSRHLIRLPSGLLAKATSIDNLYHSTSDDPVKVAPGDTLKRTLYFVVPTGTASVDLVVPNLADPAQQIYLEVAVTP